MGGEYHNEEDQKLHDKNRESDLKSFGLKVIRFDNQTVLNDIQKVIEEIRKNVRRASPLGDRGAAWERKT